MQSPTDFWLDTFDPIEVVESPPLYASVAKSGVEGYGHPQEHSAESPRRGRPSVLVLRVQAAASYYSTNRELMEHPPEVDLDISRTDCVPAPRRLLTRVVLDPYILNILPRSLVPIAIYVSFAAVGAWYLSAITYGWLLSEAAATISKPHTD